VQVVPVLGALGLLRSACFVGSPPKVPLPASLPWLAGLERLVAPCELLLSSRQALSAATNLQRLGLIMPTSHSHLPHVEAVLQWAAGHNSVRYVSLFRGVSTETRHADVKVVQAMVEKWRRPALHIERMWDAYNYDPLHPYILYVEDSSFLDCGQLKALG
jgi:hypothetical protein